MPFVAACLVLFTPQTPKTPVWTEQTFSGGIKISSPKKLSRAPQQVVDPGMLKVEFWQTQLENCVFVIGVSTMKEPAKSQTSSLFSATAAGFSSGPGVAITGMKDLLLQGWPGIAVTVRQPEGVVGVSRTYRANELLVQVCGFYPADIPRPSAVDKFLSSIKFPSDGESKVAGPQMTRFPLGDSGLSALFPSEPQHSEKEVGKGAAKGPMHVYAADYGMRSFQVAYRDIPTEKKLTDEELDAARIAIAEEVVASFHAKKVKQKDEAVGEDQGLSVEFAIGNEATGKLLIYMHGNRMVILVELAPRAYPDPATVDVFLRSVEWKA